MIINSKTSLNGGLVNGQHMLPPLFCALQKRPLDLRVFLPTVPILAFYFRNGARISDIFEFFFSRLYGISYLIL